MRKQQLLDKINLTWIDFKASFDGLSEAQLLEPDVTGSWSVKDILAHVSTWEEEAIKYLPSIMHGIRPPRYADLYGGIDAFNAKMTEAKRQLTLVDVLRQLNDTHQRLVDVIQRAPDDQIATETRFRRRIRLDTYSHYPVHTRAILEWREAQPKTNS
jgi:hypothetical protein